MPTAARYLRLAILLGMLTAALGAARSGGATALSLSPAWQAKVDPWVLDRAQSGETEFLIVLSEQADLSGAASLKTKAEKGAYVYQRLTEVARRTQAPLLQELQRRGVPRRAFWVSNMIWVQGSPTLVQELARRKDVARLSANPHVRLQEPGAGLIERAPLVPDSPQAESAQWNLLKVNADKVWAAGITGQGAVVGGQDTGYAWQHPALIDQYRGWNGSADHDYAWHDAIHANDSHTAPGNPCGFDSPAPCDDGGHGTHTMGILAGGRDAQNTHIGMAPGAKWIGCRNMEQGWGTPATYTECYQWFIAPTRIDGSDPRPDLAPDVINNSWTCPASEGCSDPNVLLSVVEAVRAAGIATVHSAGNYGDDGLGKCYTVMTPAAIYAASLTVGATNQIDAIASFSSWGPVSVDGSNRLKPEVTAPGVSITSSYTNPLYYSLSGTSMAAPHVAGLVALLVSANSGLRGQPDLLQMLVERSAVPLTASEDCGGVPGSSIPNNTFGWGRIDAYAAYQLAVPQIHKTPSQRFTAFGDLLTYTLTITNSGVLSPAHNVILTDALPAHTAFISASAPYSQTGSVLRWDFASLLAGESRSVTLTVQTPLSGTVLIENAAYGVTSDELLIPISGPPVVTLNGLLYFFPFISR